jgi:hypothetical protein
VVLNGLSLAVEGIVLHASRELNLGVREALLDGLAGHRRAERRRNAQEGAGWEHRRVVRCNWAAICICWMRATRWSDFPANTRESMTKRSSNRSRDDDVDGAKV